jgi:hypothetical protein
LNGLQLHPARRSPQYHLEIPAEARLFGSRRSVTKGLTIGQGDATRILAAEKADLICELTTLTRQAN